jgi:hypothetical protein
MSDPPDIQTVAEVQPNKPGVLARIRQLSPWRFVFVISVIQVAAKLLQLPLWTFVFHYYQPSGVVSTGQPWWEKLGWPGTFLVAAVVAPWIETILGQALWMVMTPTRSRPTMGYIVPATIWFCFLHGAGSGSGWWPGWVSLDWWLMILPHGVASFILACTFQHGWTHSWWRGIWTTSMVHCAGNLAGLMILLLILLFLPSNP